MYQPQVTLNCTERGCRYTAIGINYNVVYEIYRNDHHRAHPDHIHFSYTAKSEGGIHPGILHESDRIKPQHKERIK